ncbi:MAG: methyltransferase [Jatrophihabitans sp.]|uniref:methyltransferase n=1 Tax=Jatrophihabitans sp. TaxID=1932789 RepID=UPI003F7ED44B
MTALTPARTCRFGPLDIEWDARVLEPRPWTLLQSEWAAELARTMPAGPLLELCAGAGHIGLAAAVLADRDLVQVEADPTAGGYAAVNAAAAGWASRTELRVARLETALHPDERFPLVIADPPYLPTDEITRWPDDPVTAIDGGPDGLAVIDLCLAAAADHLLPGGVLLLQVAGARQADRLDARAAPLGLRAGEVRSHDAARAVVALHRA